MTTEPTTPAPTPAPHKATPEQWERMYVVGAHGDIHSFVASVTCELADRLAAAEQLIQTHASLLASTQGRLAELAELAQQQFTPDDAGIFPVEYADADGDGIRILMEPADATGAVCWVVRNSRYINPCREFSTAHEAFAAHQSAARQHAADLRREAAR